MSEPALYEARTRVCDLGYLREAYRKADGTIGFRCAAEPTSVYQSKGGAIEDTVGRKCVCNALMANIGLGQVRGRGVEAGLVTSGDDLAGLTRFMMPGTTRYTAADVVSYLLTRPSGDPGGYLRSASSTLPNRDRAPLGEAAAKSNCSIA
jgi:nitronate monooxygenase